MMTEEVFVHVKNEDVETRGLDPADKEMFFAERSLLLYAAERLGGEGKADLGALYEFIVDISSSDAASQVFLAYGFIEPRRYSDKEVAEHYEKGFRNVNSDRRVVVQELCLYFQEALMEDSPEFRESLSSQYIFEDFDGRSGLQIKLYERAFANLGVYSDRRYILENEDEILSLMQTYFGEERATLFARFYRVGEYRQAFSYGRSGNVPPEVRFGTTMRDSLNLGKSVADHVNGTRREWTNLRGQQRAGYGRCEGALELSVKEHDRQQEIVDVLKLPMARARLSPREIELLEITTSTVLSGGMMKDAVAAYRDQVGNRVDTTTIRAVERKVLELEDLDRLVVLQRRDDLNFFLLNQKAQERLSELLQDILYAYHVAKTTLQDEALHANVSVYDCYEVRRFVERLIFGTDDVTYRGELSEWMIDQIFREGRVPNTIIAIVDRLIDEKPDVVTEEVSVLLGVELPKRSLYGLRIMVQNIVMGVRQEEEAQILKEEQIE